MSAPVRGGDRPRLPASEASAGRPIAGPANPLVFFRPCEGGATLVVVCDGKATHRTLARREALAMAQELLAAMVAGERNEPRVRVAGQRIAFDPDMAAKAVKAFGPGPDIDPEGPAE